MKIFLAFTSALSLSVFLFLKIEGSLKKRVFLKNKRLGGTILIISIFLILVLFQVFTVGFLLPKDFLSLAVGFVVILLGGLWDDLKKISWLRQAIFQSLLALILVLAGDTIRHIRYPDGAVLNLSYLLGGVLTYFWVMIVINSFNWLDGIDGLAGSVGLVSFMVLGALSLTQLVNQPSTAILCFVVAGALLGFLFFNFPPAKFYLGTTGSWLIGFLLATVSLYSGGKVATTAIVLGIPLLDFSIVFLERMLRGKLPVLGGDRLHLHERMKALGWSHLKITLVFGFFTLCLGSGTLIFQNEKKVFLFFPLALLFFALAYFFLSENQKRRKKEEKYPPAR